MNDIPSHALLAFLWLIYFLIHSWLASLRLKHLVATKHPRLMPWYRIIFNLLALILLIPPLGYMWYLHGEPLWQWHGVTAWISYGLMLFAIFAYIWSLKFYDGSEFIGLRQLRANCRDVKDQEAFHLSPLHRYVRHPWYSLGLVLVWVQEMDSARLVTALMITLYLIIGSIQEEKKLLVYHGDRYRIYRKLVPGLIPNPWRFLSRDQANELLHGQ